MPKPDCIEIINDEEELEAAYLEELSCHKRVCQNLFYTVGGASSFYTYRGTDLTEIRWRDEYEFFRRQPFWTPDARMAFVSLGCGNAQAEEMLLHTAHVEGYHLDYWGVDSSRTMLELAVDKLAPHPFTKTFLLADFTRPEFRATLTRHLDDYDVRIYAMIGGTFGNFAQTYITGALQALLPAGAYFYLDIVPQYPAEEQNARLRDRLARLPQNLHTFFENLLAKLSLTPEDGRIYSEWSSDPELDTLHFTYFMEVTRPLHVTWRGQQIDLEAGDCLELFNVRAYAPASLKSFMAAHDFRFVDDYAPDVGKLSHLWQRFLFQKVDGR